ncbi:hypothetical protein F5884DRAFT_745809 [Xylogone sp. PMI_703]|nr:hypothetical protein F5884DRAFT_745809 [Xylogone sp. PMI_703]
MAFTNAFKSFWHTMTSYDRHSSFDSPYRTGQHVPLSQSRHAPLTSVATSASESHMDVSSPYAIDGDSLSVNGAAYPGSPMSGHPQSPVPNSPYSPGMRSAAARRQSADNPTPGDIQMQAFQEGLPPPPPVAHSWQRIDRWAEEHYAELFDQLGEGCTNNDLNELEHMLDCSLPMEVRESLQVHDGQERGGMPTGIIFGCMLLDCEEIVQEWQNWKTVNQEYLSEPVGLRPQAPSKVLGGSSAASSSKSVPPPAGPNPNWKQDLLARQDSQPPNAIQKAYAHPAWIPLVRDWGGNNLAIDLAPGPAGKWGQVILMGRDYDRKYVVARSWSALLATVADDLNSAKWFVDEDSGELKLREFKAQSVEPGYFDILRWRADQKYGRKPPPNRKSMGPNPNRSSRSSPAGSPYSSPPSEIGGEPRGRSMQRFSGASPVASPNRPSYGKPSPLARVTEETAAIRLDTSSVKPDKLVEVETPLPPSAGEVEKRRETMKSLLDPVTPVIEKGEKKEDTKPQEDAKEDKKEPENDSAATNGSAKVEDAEDESTMKTIEI